MSEEKKGFWGRLVEGLSKTRANIVAGIAGGFIFYGLLYLVPDKMFITSSVGAYVMLFLQYYIAINCSLAVFNLLPIPPLDGSKILFAFLPDRIVYKIYEKEQIISVVLMALLFMGVLSIPLAFLSGLVNNLVSFISKLPFALIFG